MEHCFILRSFLRITRHRATIPCVTNVKSDSVIKLNLLWWVSTVIIDALTQTAVQHGATEHPEVYCHLCRWQFECPESLQNHIRHFVAHPKCLDCELRFADADAYQHVSFLFGSSSNVLMCSVASVCRA